MRKSVYQTPELDIVVLHDDLLDTLPKSSTPHDDDEILAKPNDLWFDDIEEDSEDDDFFISLWED